MWEKFIVLILPIKKKWFDMNLSGEKKRGYRDIKPYYMNCFRKLFWMYPYSNVPMGGDARENVFRNGYSSNSPSFIATCSLDIKTANPEWGGSG